MARKKTKQNNDTSVLLTNNRNVPSLVKLSALSVCQHLNTQFATPTEDLVGHILSLPQETVGNLFPLLHYRWVDTLTKKAPELASLAAPFLTASMRREEDFLRSKNSLAGQVSLINIFGEKESFKFREYDQSKLCLESASPYAIIEQGTISPYDRKDFSWPELLPGESAIATKEQFLKQFALFTENQLKGIDWNNIFVAGGSVLACLLPVPEEYSESDADIKEFYHNVAYESSDIDIFLYGLDAEQSKAKVSQVIKAIKNAYPNVPLSWFRSSQTITVIREYPYRPIQIVISNFQHKAEVIANFDIDSVCVGFDGKDVLCLPRCREAINTRTNVINTSLQKTSYRRILKSQSRGFAFAMPDFLTVPFGKRETSLEKIDLLLASAKMNLLHDYDVTFDHSDNISNWTNEYIYGVSINLEPRSIDKEVDLPCKIPEMKTDNENMEWDSSCGVFGISYFQNAKLTDITGRIQDECCSDLDELEEIWDEIDFESPWTWDGAPEFLDWDYRGSEATEIATISFTELTEKFVISVPKESEPGEEFYVHKTKPDPQGFVYNLRFSVTDENSEEGFKVVVELAESPVSEDPLCSIVGMLIFQKSEGHDNRLTLDLAYNFTSENRNCFPVTAWNETLENNNIDTTQIYVTAEIRSLKQTIPLN